MLNNANAPQNRLTKPRTNPYELYDDREFTKRLSKPTALPLTLESAVSWALVYS